jgi:predicted RNA-binding Zn-ribbon protein involved in translation (DUF1610 family)
MRLHQKAIDNQWRFGRWDRNSSRCPRSGLNKALHEVLLRRTDYGRERCLAEYVAALPGSTDYGCPACGSLLVHAHARARELVINCKDCMARSVLPEAD